jgi:hypothetical protein
MIAFRVSINGQPPVTGGANDLSVLTAIVTATGLLGTHTRPPRPDEKGETNIDFRLGGLSSRAVGVANEHVIWLENVSLSPGDTVTVEVIDSERADPVASSSEADAKEEYDRELFKFAKKHYLALRDKYEPDL